MFGLLGSNIVRNKRKETIKLNDLEMQNTNTEN